MIWFVFEFILLIFLIVLAPKKRLDHLTILIFNLMWCGGLAFSNLGLFELYRPSNQTNILFIISIIVFNFVYRLSIKGNDGDNLKERGIDNINETFINLKFLLLVNIFVLFLCLPYIPKAFHIYQMHGMSYLRSLVYIQTPEYFSNIYISLLFQWLIQPFLQFVLLLTASQIGNFKHNKVLLLFALVDLCSELLLFGGGRRTIIMFLLQIAIFYFLKNSPHLSRYIRINIKKIGVIIFVFFIIMVVINITASRLTRISVSESLFQYYVGPFIFFDRITIGGTECSLFTKRTFGSCVFSFVIVPFNILMMIFGRGYNNSMAQNLNNRLDMPIAIGNHSFHNAHATSLIYFCNDFGFYLSFIGTFIFAFIISFFTKRYDKNNRSFILAVYFSSLIFQSAQTYPFIGIIQYVVIFFTFLFVKNSNKNLIKRG